jgi:predicted kinase
LAHRIAKAIPCPAISRDEIKEGMVHAQGDTFEPSAGDPLTRRTFSVFFEILRVLLEEDVTVVAEAAFQDPLWREGLKPLTDHADLRIIRCNVEPATAHRRYRDRGERGAHASIIGAGVEDWARKYESFAHLSLAEPSIDVDTTDGYSPSLDEIIEFLNRGGQDG